MRVIRALVACGVAATVLGAGACAQFDARGTTRAVFNEGDQRAGRRAIIDHGCGSCHRIPGIPNANALVGPPLDGWRHRSFIAGTLPNSAENLSIWLEDPQQVRPGSAMPDLDLDPSEVADIVTYLFMLD